MQHYHSLTPQQSLTYNQWPKSLRMGLIEYLTENSNNSGHSGTVYYVPQIDNVYYVYAYDNITKCESDRVPVQVVTNPCDNCISEFSPTPGKYVLSAWVKENINNVTTLSSPSISFSYDGTAQKSGPFKAKGPIIDGWQKIEEEFIIPDNATSIYVELNNTSSTNNVYFDDIRIPPFASNLGSYVYDPASMKLVAELDDKNFATFYTYNEEGNLISIKKETEEGIKTVKEQQIIMNTNTYNSIHE
jgi:YD repeat-containing protein